MNDFNELVTRFFKAPTIEIRTLLISAIGILFLIFMPIWLPILGLYLMFFLSYAVGNFGLHLFKEILKDDQSNKN